MGGGAAGFFGAITCAEAMRGGGATVLLLEATAHLLSKVRISGGGRCNVTHACFDPRRLVEFYPRGARELLGAFHRWQPRDTVDWFEARGVRLKTEQDGRMFPVTDRSETIVACLQRAAAEAGVAVRTRAAVKAVVRREDGFAVELGDGERLSCRQLLLATGGGRSSAGFALARDLGHTIEPPVPSLFTFHIDDPRLKGLEGLAVENATLRAILPGEGAARRERLETTGSLLITHWGLSGPATLKLSAWGARAFAACDYRFELAVSWLGGRTLEAAREDLARARTGEHCRQRVANWNPWGLPSRLWERLTASAGVPADGVWAALSRPAAESLAQEAAAARFAVAGKSLNKDEFVTCGGVRLAEVDFRTLESRRCPGLHLAGEVLDIDGLTGGFNFQAAWTTARLAGEAMARCRRPR